MVDISAQTDRPTKGETPKIDNRLDDPALRYSYNTCFAKTPRQIPFIKPSFVEHLADPGAQISSYRDDLSKFATAVSNASFVEKHGVSDYIKLLKHCQLVNSIQSHKNAQMLSLAKGDFQPLKSVPQI